MGSSSDSDSESEDDRKKRKKKTKKASKEDKKPSKESLLNPSYLKEARQVEKEIKKEPMTERRDRYDRERSRSGSPKRKARVLEEATLLGALMEIFGVGF